ncbi:hypothetical protein F5B22DRAFT_644265 [Xylaria bambusicola]|uniref:uncharacterized protein n=1 Tax=Xylaria bambusicola TaxID=326684 RepID=UPI00200735C4|nr:uncharacterized protein F5B22DRAFT_644265 [Xylaria bambusicola]KAI0521021.1 hypothetical protein F5B22DRAFT_644265 [Xylaria bambusicola]
MSSSPITYTYQSPYKPTPTSSQLDKFIRYLRLKIYRIEVTYGIYVYTPVEKVVFWTLFCFLFSAISTVTILYTHRILLFGWHIFLESGVLSDSVLPPFSAAKHAATELTTSVRTEEATPPGTGIYNLAMAPIGRTLRYADRQATTPDLMRKRVQPEVARDKVHLAINARSGAEYYYENFQNRGVVHSRYAQFTSSISADLLK